MPLRFYRRFRAGPFRLNVSMRGLERAPTPMFRETRSSCRHREFAVHRLLPDVGIDVTGNGLLLFGGKGWGGELGEHLIKKQ
jgi:hypothetical protein